MFRHFRRNWLSWMTLLLLAVLLFNVEQIRNLFEWPRLSSGSWTIAAGLYGFIIVLAALYLLVGAWVVPFDQTRLSNTPTGISAWTRSTIDRHRIFLAIVAATLSLISLTASLFVSGEYLLDPPILRSLGLLAAAAAAVFATWRALASPTQRLLTRALIALVGLNLLGELLWYLGNEHELFSPRNYSLWAILHVFFCAFLFARIVDVWQSYNELPIRGMALILVVIAVGWTSPSNVGEALPFSSLNHATVSEAHPVPAAGLNSLPATDNWLRWIQARLKQIPDDGPVILVAASGGGSRAALFTSLVYEDLEREAVAYGEDRRKYAPADHVLMISSVSGGTLASSCYLDREYTQKRQSEKVRRALRNSIEEELLLMMRSELEAIKDLRWNRRVDPKTGRIIVDFSGLAEYELRRSAAPWFFRCPFADDMCTDFMAPLLRGALHPGRDRGESVRWYWQKRFGLQETNLEWLRRGGPTPSEVVSPLLLCNVCEVERGSRLIIGFPPLPPGFLAHSGQRGARALVDLDSRRELATQMSLGDATRISANFPWGFPIASVEIPQFDEAGNETQSDVHVIDGGICDNTGIDSLRYVIDALAYWSDLEIPQERVDEDARIQRLRRAASSKILQELQRRGVLLLEIDSGAKPERSGAFARFLSGILEPIGAMQNAGYASAAAAFRTHLDTLDRTIPNSRCAAIMDRIARLKLRSPRDDFEDLSPLNIVNVKRLTITCNHQKNVMTAWALGPSDKAQIFVRFLVGSERLRYEMAEFLAEYSSSRTALGQLERKLAELERADDVNPESLSEVISALNDVVAMSQAAQNLTALRIGSEKLFYQGVALPKEVLDRVDDEIRSRPEWSMKLPPDVVPDVMQTHAPRPGKKFDNGGEFKFDRIQQTADEIDWNLKQKRRETFDRIEKLSVQ